MLGTNGLKSSVDFAAQDTHIYGEIGAEQGQRAILTGPIKPQPVELRIDVIIIITPYT